MTDDKETNENETTEVETIVTETETETVQGVVVEAVVDNRNSMERLQDTCFEGLLDQYTVRQDWDVVTMTALLWDRVRADREIQTHVQIDSTSPQEDTSD
jgi:hypothetical protein